MFHSAIKKIHSTWNGIDYSSPRGYWSGKPLAWYHTSHYGPKLADRLLSFFLAENATSIVDLGGGAGLHTQHFIQNGIFASCYDGNPDSQDISGGICSTMDLTKPMNFARFEWVMSLSVGRQIPVSLEDAFIANIHNLNKKGVDVLGGWETRNKSKECQE